MTQTDRLQRAAERRDLTQGPITKKIILFSIPIIFGNLFQQLYNKSKYPCYELILL